MATSTQDWIEELKGISVLELAERIKALEEEFGVSATAADTPHFSSSVFTSSETCMTVSSLSWFAID